MSSESLSRKLYLSLLAEIRAGVLQPGSTIREKRPGHSQGTVRHALLMLENDRLVVRRPHRETAVVNLTRQDVVDLVDTRVPLEILACKKAAPNLADPAAIAEVRSHLERIGISPTADEDFHRSVWRLSDNPLLVATLEQLSAPLFAFVPLLRRKGLQRAGDRVAAHKVLLEALINRPPHLEDLIEQHVRGAYTEFCTSPIPDLRSVAQMADAPGGAMSPTLPTSSKHEEFLRWIPATAAVWDGFGEVLYTNGFEQGLDRGLHPYASGAEVLRRAVGRVIIDRQSQLVASRSHGRTTVSICFPLSRGPEQRGTLHHGAVGQFGVDVSDVLPSEAVAHPVRVRIQPSSRTDGRQSSAPATSQMLTAFFRAIPAVATWKDLQGRLLWANPAYEAVTQKPLDEAVGHSSSENWPGPLGQLIAAHDAIVRETGSAYLTTDKLTFVENARCRVTVRFPILDERHRLQETASLGFDYELLRQAQRLLSGLPAEAHTYARLESEVTLPDGVAV